MEKFKVIIIDDEPLARQLLQNYMKEQEKFEVVAECADGFEALKMIKQLDPELILLDIQMPKISGFELLEVLQEAPLIIFTTAFEQYALKAFEMNAVDYLLKPFSKDRFNTALDKAFSQLASKKTPQENISILNEQIQNEKGVIDRVITRMGSKITVIPVDKIAHIEAQDDYVMLYTETGNHLKERTMKYFEEHLPANTFVRVHRSFIVNINFITGIEPYTKEIHLIKMKSGTMVKASPDGYRKLRNLM
jgi:two-component system, LytTR family, response regulator